MKPFSFRSGSLFYDTNAASDESALDCLAYGPSMTQQQFADECDINLIVARYGLTGVMPETVKLPMYGDFTGIGDYREAIEAVRAADASFMELPPSVRAYFENDPQRLLEFVADDKNRDKAVELGLLKKLPDPPLPAAVEAAKAAAVDKPV